MDAAEASPTLPLANEYIPLHILLYSWNCPGGFVAVAMIWEKPPGLATQAVELEWFSRNLFSFTKEECARR